MRLTFNTALSIQPVDNDANEASGMKYVNDLSGSQDSSLPSPYDENTTLQNVLQLNEVEIKHFQLTNGNTFAVSLYDLLQTSIADTSFIHIFCKEIKTPDKPLPVFFDLKLNGTKIARVSQFSIPNLRDWSITSLEIETIQVPADKIAGLYIIVGSRNQNQP